MKLIFFTLFLKVFSYLAGTLLCFYTDMGLLDAISMCLYFYLFTMLYDFDILRSFTPYFLVNLHFIPFWYPRTYILSSRYICMFPWPYFLDPYHLLTFFHILKNWTEFYTWCRNWLRIYSYFLHFPLEICGLLFMKLEFQLYHILFITEFEQEYIHLKLTSNTYT